MSEIVKTEAVVLSKLSYGDSSSIVSLFTEKEGKISAIAKGARSPKSKYGRIIDPINYLHLVFYKKESRELHFISGAEIADYFPAIKSDLEKLKYSYAIIELIKNLLPDHEINRRLFRGTVRILSRINSSKERPEISFGRFFIFILKEVGYEIQVEKCAICNRQEPTGDDYYFHFEKGLICGKCKERTVEIYRINLELLSYLRCLKNNIDVINFDKSEQIRAISLLEKYAQFHVHGFKNIQSLRSFI